MANTAMDVQVARQVDVPGVVRLLLHLKGVKGKDLKDVLHLSQPQISQRLSGRVQFRVDELVALADYLRVEPAVFFMTLDDAIRSRCFAALAPTPGQMTLALGVERPSLRAV